MTFLAPASLLGLLALPLIVWLHRRRQRPAAVDVPSLMFLEGETADSLAPERVRFDAELILSLLAATLLAIAAAGPAFGGGESGRRIRVVVDRGPSMEAKAGDGKTAHQRADEAVERIRGSIRRADRIEVVDGDPLRLDLVSLARVGDAGLRIVVSDRLPSPPPSDVRVVAVGDPNVRSVGVVALDVTADAKQPDDPVDVIRVFANFWNDGPFDVTIRPYPMRDGEDVRYEGQPIDIPARSARSAILKVHLLLPEEGFEIRLPFDDFLADDVVSLGRSPLLVSFSGAQAEGYPAAHLGAVRAALDLVLGQGGWREDDDRAELRIGIAGDWPDSARVVLGLLPIPAGKEGVRAPTGKALIPPPALEAISRDLGFSSSDLVYVAGMPFGGGAPTVTIERFPATTRATVVMFHPDPLAGRPAPVDTPVWPIFMENVVREAHGRPGPPGYRIRDGLLDPRASRLGRDAAPFDARWLDGVKSEPGAAPKNLRPFAVAAALLLLVALWGSGLLGAKRRVR